MGFVSILVLVTTLISLMFYGLMFSISVAEFVCKKYKNTTDCETGIFIVFVSGCGLISNFYTLFLI